MPHPVFTEISKNKPIYIALSVIALLGVIVVAIGVGGFYDVGLLHHLGRHYSIIVMSVGAIVAVASLSIAAMVALVRCSQNKIEGKKEPQVIDSPKDDPGGSQTQGNDKADRPQTGNRGIEKDATKASDDFCAKGEFVPAYEHIKNAALQIGVEKKKVDNTVTVKFCVNNKFISLDLPSDMTFYECCIELAELDKNAYTTLVCLSWKEKVIEAPLTDSIAKIAEANGFAKEPGQVVNVEYVHLSDADCTRIGQLLEEAGIPKERIYRGTIAKIHASIVQKCALIFKGHPEKWTEELADYLRVFNDIHNKLRASQQKVESHDFTEIFVGMLIGLLNAAKSAQALSEEQKAESTTPNQPVAYESSIPEVKGELTLEEIEAKKQQLDLGSMQIFIKTLSGKTITASVNETSIEDLKQIYLHEFEEGFKLIFAGKAIEYQNHKSLKKLLDTYNIQKESTLHIVGTLKSSTKKSQTKKSQVNFQLMNGKSLFCPNFDPQANIMNACFALAKKDKRTPETTLVRMIFCGKLLSNSDNMSKNYFAVEREYELPKETCVHVLMTSISKQECEVICEFWKEEEFPDLKGKKLEAKIDYIRALIWSECDRVFRKRPGSGPGLEKHIKILVKLLGCKFSKDVDSFVKGLLDLASDAYSMYKTSANSTFDELLGFLKSQIQSVSYEPDERKIKVRIEKSCCAIEAGKLMELSTNFAISFKDKIANEEAIDLEGHSPHLIDYLSGSLNFQGLDYCQIDKLLDTATCFVFDELAILCQITLIQKLQNEKEVTQEMKSIFKKKPVLFRALYLRLTQDLWNSKDFAKKLEKIKDNIPEKVSIVRTNSDPTFTLVMPSKKVELEKSQLLQCKFFRDYFSDNPQNKNTDLPQQFDWPDEIITYLTTGKKILPTLENIQQLVSCAEQLDISELICEYKNFVYNKLSHYYAQKDEKSFCELCMEIGIEINQWLNG